MSDRCAHAYKGHRCILLLDHPVGPDLPGDNGHLYVPISWDDPPLLAAEIGWVVR